MKHTERWAAGYCERYRPYCPGNCIKWPFSTLQVMSAQANFVSVLLDEDWYVTQPLLNALLALCAGQIINKMPEITESPEIISQHPCAHE